MRAKPCAASSTPSSADEIIFTRNATSAINLVARSFGGPRIGEGDEIVLSIMEHHSNIVPWHFHPRAQGRGAEVGADRPTAANSCIEEFERLLTQAHQDGRHHAHVERARHH